MLDGAALWEQWIKNINKLCDAMCCFAEENTMMGGAGADAVASQKHFFFKKIDDTRERISETFMSSIATNVWLWG